MIITYIFDLDDTIIDSSLYAKMYPEIIDELLSSLNISKLDLQQIINKLKTKSGKQRVDTYELCEKVNSTEIYYKVLENNMKYLFSLKAPYLPKIFSKIKSADKQIGIASNARERTIEIILRRFDLLKYIDFIESGKKDTLVFWLSLDKKHDLKKELTLVVDNDEEILEKAAAAGYKVLNVKSLDQIEKFNY